MPVDLRDIYNAWRSSRYTHEPISYEYFVILIYLIHSIIYICSCIQELRMLLLFFTAVMSNQECNRNVNYNRRRVLLNADLCPRA